MDPIRFNETPDYIHLNILGVSGVFTPNNIRADSLPDGFYKYGLIPGDETVFSAVTNKDVPEADCSFISREQMDLGRTGERRLDEADWAYQDAPFVFDAHFGQKLAFDTQVELAEAKRDAKNDGKKSKKRGKGNKYKEHDERD